MMAPLLFVLAAAPSEPAAAAAAPAIACRADALDKEQRARQKALLETVRRTAVVARELPDGFLLSVPTDGALFVQLAEWISLERRCCPFLEFALEWKTDGVSVRLTGPEGVKEMIAAEMGVASSR
jgi:hypothetical protein